MPPDIKRRKYLEEEWDANNVQLQLMEFKEKIYIKYIKCIK